MADVKFLYGSQSGFDALQTKDENTLYFCTDTGKLYKGSVDFAESIIIADGTSSSDTTAKIVPGKLYYFEENKSLQIFTKDSEGSLESNTLLRFVEYDPNYDIGGYSPYSSFDIITADSLGYNLQLVKGTADGAASNAAYAAQLAGECFDNVSAGTASLTFNRANSPNSTEEIIIPGVVTTPTWDATTRKLTLYVSDSSSPYAQTIEVNLGKDIFIDPSADNGYNAETNTIDLYLNDGTEDADPTKVSIPASALVDIYTGTTSNGTNVTVSDDNVIKVDLVIDPAEGNALVLTETGLKVDLSAYAKTETVTALDARVAALESAPAAAQWGTF